MVTRTSAITPDAANVGRAAAESCRCAAAAQQLSACDWLTIRVAECSWLSDVCIGQLVPFMQHAIRASGVACQPAQTATLPTSRGRRATTAAHRRINATTLLEWWTCAAMSNGTNECGCSCCPASAKTAVSGFQEATRLTQFLSRVTTTRSNSEVLGRDSFRQFLRDRPRGQADEHDTALRMNASRCFTCVIANPNGQDDLAKTLIDVAHSRRPVSRPRTEVQTHWRPVRCRHDTCSTVWASPAAAGSVVIRVPTWRARS